MLADGAGALACLPMETFTQVLGHLPLEALIRLSQSSSSWSTCMRDVTSGSTELRERCSAALRDAFLGMVCHVEAIASEVVMRNKLSRLASVGQMPAYCPPTVDLKDCPRQCVSRALLALVVELEAQERVVGEIKAGRDAAYLPPMRGMLGSICRGSAGTSRCFSSCDRAPAKSMVASNNLVPDAAQVLSLPAKRKDHLMRVSGCAVSTWRGCSCPSQMQRMLTWA